jgi:drug/metabolite transporter (DMT)-like permease
MGRRYLLLGVVTAGWGTIPVLAGLVNLPSPLIVAIRLWTAAICLGAVLLVEEWRARRRGAAGPGRYGWQSVGPAKLLSVRPWRCLLTAAVLGVHWLALFAAYKRAPAGTVILIVYLAPLGVAALAPRLLGERLGRRTVAALVAATLGFALLAAPAVHSAGVAGLLLSLIAAVLFVALILLSKPLAVSYGGLRLAFMELGGAGILLVPVALATTWPPPAATWLWVVVLGVVHTALGITLYLSVLADLPATHVGILGYLEPVVVVLAAWLWLGQRPGWATVAGGLLVVAAGVSIATSGRSPGWRRREIGDLGDLVGSVDPAVPSP